MTLPPFKERAPWWGGHLQTIRNTIWPYPKDLSAWPALRGEIDFENGDKTYIAIHGRERATTSRCVLLVHGLTGCEDSVYIRQTARCLLEAGACVIRANLRGAGPSNATSREHYNAGRSRDLARIIAGCLDHMPDGTLSGLGVVGYSLGGNILLKMLGEGLETAWPVSAAVSVSAPVNLKLCQQRLMEPRSRVYHNYLLKRMKAETPGISEDKKRAIKTVWDFDEQVVAPSDGYAGAEDYYAKASAEGYLANVRTPTLLLHADNDPWIPKAMYEQGTWRHNPALEVEIARGGGHVGFHGAGGPLPWHSHAALNFFRAKV